jgi:phosphatidylinositol kinase/protein kinase (PI-3  family)
MMVEALGVAGVDGLFRSTFVYMAQMLRENGQVLEMVLSVFVHEPLVDPDATDESIIGLDPSEESLISPALPHLVSKAPTGSIVDVGRVYMKGASFIPSSQEMRNRVRQKLTGTERPDRTMTVGEQATWLIEMATDPYNLAQMYSGWCPFW